VHDDEQHLAVLGRERPLRAEQQLQLQVIALGLGVAQVPVHRFVVQIDAASVLRHGRVAAHGMPPAAQNANGGGAPVFMLPPS
jgi:hypothetical protein